MPILDRKTYSDTPKEVISWKIVFFAAILSFSGALHGFNTANISGVLAMKPFQKHFGLNHLSTSAKADWTGWLTSVLILGCCGGALVCSPFTDKLGRKWSLALWTVILVLSAVLMTANPGGDGGRAEFLVGRTLSGFGAGAASIAGTGYMAEISPKAIRGGLTALYNANTMLCVGLAYWVNYGSLQHISSDRDAQWQVPMAVQALPGVILLLEQAKASLERLRSLSMDHPFVRQEFNEILRGVEAEQTVNAGGIRGTLDEMLSRSIRKRLIMVMIIQSTNYLFSGIYGIVKFVTVIVYCLFIIDRLGRRRGLFTGSLMIILSLIYLTVYLAVAHPSSSSSSGTPAVGWVAVVFIYIFAIGYAISWGTIPWIINAEVFPTRVRAICMSFCITWQYLVNFALTRGQPNMVIAMHPYGPFLLFACMTILMTVYSYFAYPETKGISMERMDELFTMPWYRVGKASVSIRQTRTDEGDMDLENHAHKN
ncbi:putative hexose transport-related protein [Xylariaceae sp. FL0662B]|nr:putative hexose transport-related protein [Xylariaceae sp. FL0662B]